MFFTTATISELANSANTGSDNAKKTVTSVCTRLGLAPIVHCHHGGHQTLNCHDHDSTCQVNPVDVNTNVESYNQYIRSKNN